MNETQTLKSRILIVHPIDPKKIDFGADVVPNISKALERNNTYSCILINLNENNLKNGLDYINKKTRSNPHTQFIIVQNNLSKENILKVTAIKNIFKILSGFNSNTISQEILFALDKFDQQEQNTVLIKLINEQNKQLDFASQNLEKAVRKRQNYLKKSQNKLENTNNTFNLLKNALIAIHKSRSTSEMEQNLYQVLHKEISLKWVRLYYASQENQIDPILNSKNNEFIYKQALSSQSENIGWCLYSTTKEASEFEEDFFIKISDALGLALDKLKKINQMESLMVQWESTFNSINQAIAIVDKDYFVIQKNKHFEENALNQSSSEKVNCFIKFLDDDISEQFSTTEFSQFNFIKEIKSKNTLSYHITVQPIGGPHSSQKLLVIFRDIAEDLKMEKYLIQSSKMAELGTIGSSIAHELNNPLGGILSFLQLIKMDLKPDDKYFDDISNMEEAALRSKDIVQNLLGFSRFQSGSPTEPFDINDSLTSALKILEIQTRSKGIEIHTVFSSNSLIVSGNQNQLSQAFVNIIQNSIDAILINFEKSPGTEGIIRVESKQINQQIEITISDNGPGMSDKVLKKIFDPLFSTKKQGSGLGLTVAYQIISQHSGTIDYFSQPQAGTVSKILFKIKN